MKTANIVKPFIRWAGGKRSLLPVIKQRLPVSIGNYYEPFLGGGALFFHLYPSIEKAFLSDKLTDLINAYTAVKNDPNILLASLAVHQVNHSQNYYYQVRSQNGIKNSTVAAARFIYLMQTCFNGLYRVNAGGQFNTPWGNREASAIFDADNIALVSGALQKAEVESRDFTEINPEPGDFVYFDPPYHKVSKTSFTKYTADGFKEDDHVRLRDFAVKLSQCGVNVMISNANTDFITDLYSKDFNVEVVPVRRKISGAASGRRLEKELLITNYSLYR